MSYSVAPPLLSREHIKAGEANAKDMLAEKYQVDHLEEAEQMIVEYFENQNGSIDPLEENTRNQADSQFEASPIDIHYPPA